MVARKANTPTLTREQIVAAAMKLVDRDGLAALSMRKLAGELGVGTMSLYYHVPEKSALYDLILDAGLAEVDLTVDDPALPVDVRVSRIAYAIRTALLNHPHAAIIAMSRSLRTPTQLRPVEKLLQVLSEAGLSASDAMQAVNIIGQYAVGVTTMYANQLTGAEYHNEDATPDFGAMTPEEFPNLFRALAEAEGAGDWDADFDAGLSALIRGLVTERKA